MIPLGRRGVYDAADSPPSSAKRVAVSGRCASAVRGSVQIDDEFGDDSDLLELLSAPSRANGASPAPAVGTLPCSCPSVGLDGSRGVAADTARPTDRLEVGHESEGGPLRTLARDFELNREVPRPVVQRKGPDAAGAGASEVGKDALSRIFTVIDVSEAGRELLLIEKGNAFSPDGPSARSARIGISRLHVRDEWLECKVEVGDTVALSVFGPGSCDGVLRGDERCGEWGVSSETDVALVVHPHILVSGTSISSSAGCLRRTVLSSCVRSVEARTAAVISGELAHALFEHGLSNKFDFGESAMMPVLREMMPRYFADMVASDLKDEEIEKSVLAMLPAMCSWAQSFVRERPRFPSEPARSRDGEPVWLAVRAVSSVEEVLRAPDRGLLGKLDAVLDVSYRGCTGGECDSFVPLELKTGKPSLVGAHSAQVALYSALLARATGRNIPFGLLLYLGKNRGFHVVRPHRAEMRSLLVRRNEIASARATGRLPPVLCAGLQRTCSFCSLRNACILQHWASGEACEGTAVAQWAPDVCGGLSEVHATFFNRWMRALDLEEAEARRESERRLEKSDFCASMGLERGNLVRLLSSSEKSIVRKRELVVELAAPVFGEPLAVLDDDCSRFHTVLNEDQREMVRKILAARDYVVVLGMPGTGKSSAISVLVQILSAAKKSVLVTAYTHAAVDVLCLKLGGLGVSFLRLGDVARVSPALRAHTVEGLQPRSSAEIARLLRAPGLVVASTALGIRNPLLYGKKFDFCIVDEASQVAQPVCIGPLCFADVFVLVGDPYQLPPLVLSHEANQLGMSESLHVRLFKAHPRAVVALKYQYRMCAEVLDLSNHLVYRSALRCATSAVAERRISLDCSALCADGAENWLVEAVAPKNPVVFLNTAALLDAREQPCATGKRNLTEAEIVRRLVRAFHDCGVGSDCIGILSPYVAQIQLLRGLLHAEWPGLDINTVDRFQGRDMPVVLISWVRSSASRRVGELLLDWRRINVALTRAQTKLVFVGDATTLTSSNFLNECIALVRDRGWMRDLPTALSLA